MKRCMGCMELYKEEVFICPHCGYEENTLPEEAFHLIPGTVIGKRYQIGRVLGFGGFGITYIGFDLLLEKKIAVKEYLPSEFATRMPSQSKVSVYSEEKTEQFNRGMNRFVEEAKKLANFSGTTEIVNVYDCLQENNTAYIIMEYLEGQSLKKWLEQKGKFTLKETEQILLPILRSLESIHEVGLIHRDIAPDNIFLTRDGRVKLLDFGAARYASATHSRSLSVIYKPGYAPEEQYQSRGNQGPWTDVYALAATTYKMLTGITPDTSLERRAKDTLQPPSKLGVELPKNKETALLNALNIQVKNRTKSAKQFLEEWESKGTVIRILETFKKADVGALSNKAKIAILSSVVAVGVIAAVVLGMGGFKKIAASIEVQEGKTRVPSVVNTTEEDALERLRKAELGMEITGREYSAEITKGLILSQNYDGGSLVPEGTKLGVVMSGGILQIYMPIVEGKGQEEAIRDLKNSGFTVAIETVYDNVVAPGNVIRTSIPANTRCDDGTIVTIYVSKGIDPGTVEEPEKKYVVEDFVGKTLDEVKSILTQNGIYVDSSKQEYDDAVPAGTVLSQETPAGTELGIGDTVFVTVSLGKQMVRIPDLRLSDLETAQKTVQELLENQGLPVDALLLECVETVYHPTIKEGLIIEQYLGGEIAVEGMEVEKGTVLYVTVSQGPEPTVTEAPAATTTPKPKMTNTPKPTATDTPRPTATNTPTNTPRPTATNTPRPTATNTPTPTPTNTPTPIPSYTVTFNSNGGSTVASRTVQKGTVVKDLPEPTREYYNFAGWTYNGEVVTRITVSNNITLVASWTEKPVSGWVNASEVPSGAQVVETKWTYTKTETTESTASYLEGWIQNGTRTEVVAQGSFEYASFPDTYSTSSSIYTGMYKSKSEVAVAAGATRNILSDGFTGYVYWHYSYPVGDKSVSNRYTGYYYNQYLSSVGCYTTLFSDFKSSTNYTTSTTAKHGGGTIYEVKDSYMSYTENGGTYWWYRFEYYTCTYQDVRTVYQYYKTTNLESTTEVANGGSISNVVKWVKYRAK